MDLIDLLAIPKAAGQVLAGPVPEGRPPLTAGEMAGRSAINLAAFASGGLSGLAKAYEFNAGIDAQNSPEARAKRQVAETQLEAMNDPKRGRLNAQRIAGVTPSLEDQRNEIDSALQDLNVQAGKQGLRYTFNNGQLSVVAEDREANEQFYPNLAEARADAAAANAALEKVGSSQRSVVLPRTAGGFQVRTFDIPLHEAAAREKASQLGEFNAVSPGLDALLGGGTRLGSAGLPPPPVGAGTVSSPASPPPPVDLSRGAAGARADLATQAADAASARAIQEAQAKATIPGDAQVAQATKMDALRTRLVGLGKTFLDAQGQSMAGQSLGGLPIGDWVESLTGGQATGPIVDWTKVPLSRYTSLGTDAQKQLIREQAEIENAFVSAISGAQVSYQEALRLARQLPRLGDDPTFFVKGIETAIANIDTTKAALANQQAGIAPLSEQEARQALKEAGGTVEPMKAGTPTPGAVAAPQGIVLPKSGFRFVPAE